MFLFRDLFMGLISYSPLSYPSLIESWQTSSSPPTPSSYFFKFISKYQEIFIRTQEITLSINVRGKENSKDNVQRWASSGENMICVEELKTMAKMGSGRWEESWKVRFSIVVCYQVYKIIVLPLLQMKKSLAPPRRDKPSGAANSLAKKMPLKLSDERGTSSEKSAALSIQIQSQDKAISQKFEERFRNKNLNVLPTQMLVTLSGLTTIDISYNKLTESQIELIMSSCTKLTTFCMQGNMSALIPAAISKLKLLVNFRHDWVKLNQQDMYESEQRLDKIKQCAKKPECVTKINKIVGLDFGRYCQYVLLISFDRSLIEKIDKCDCSNFARTNMLKCVEEMSKGKIKQKDRLVTIHEGEQRSLIPGCFGAFGFGESTLKKRDQKWKQAQCSTDNESVNTHIKIEDIRDITDKQMSLTTANDPRTEEVQFYSSPGFPLHQLFANFDRNPHAPAEIDGLLLKGYNPNQYDSNGLSAFHLLIVNRQKKGLEYLIEISANNPGFFDLEMSSIKEGRSLLHLSVFMKNYLFTKMLIEFGLPIDKRDGSGARIIHLVDQNYEFLILLRKLFRKRTKAARNLSTLAVPMIPHQNKKNYTKHPFRQKEESRFRITYSKNDKLLEMYESAAGIPTAKI